MKERLFPRERLLRTINHEEVDRVPVVPNMSKQFLAKVHNCGIWDITWKHLFKTAVEFGYDPIVFWGWHPEFWVLSQKIRPKVEKKNLGTTLLLTRRYSTLKGELTETLRLPKDKFFREQGGHDETSLVKNFLIKTEEDLEKLPYVFQDPYDIKVEEFEQMKETVGDKALIMAFLPDALLNVVRIYGIQNLMFGFYDRRDFVMQLLKVVQEQVLKRTEAIVTKLKGLKVAYSSGCWTTESFWSPEMFSKVFAPLVAEQTKLLHENGVFHHYFVDGKCMGHLEKLKEIEIDVFSSLEPPPSGDGDLKIAKERVGDKICLYGNVDPIQVVERGRKKGIIKATKKAIDNAAEGGGFILGLGEFVSYRTPPENLKTFIETGKRYGRYN